MKIPSSVSCWAGSLAWAVSAISPSVLLLQTNKEDELSRRIKNLLGHWDSRVLLSHESPLNPKWIPEKPKSRSQTSSHKPAFRMTNPYERKSSLESLDLRPYPKQNYDHSIEGRSNQRSEAKGPQSKILPEPVKVSAIVGALCCWQPLKAKGAAHGPCLACGSASPELKGTWFPGALKTKLSCFKAKFHKGRRMRKHTRVIKITITINSCRSSSSSSSNSNSSSGKSTSSNSLRVETVFPDCHVPRGTQTFLSEEDEVTVGISAGFLPGLQY